jgi:hypothetical protein
MGGDSGPHKPVHEPTTDSQFGEDETGDSAVLAPPRHRPELDDGGLSCKQSLQLGAQKVIDGREVSWEQFGQMLMTFEGWQFKLELRDRSEEV